MSALDRVTDALERATILDRVAAPVAEVWGRVFTPGRLTDLASGTPLGHPAHPLLVQGTAGLLLSATVLDAYPGQRMRPAAAALTGLGVASAVPTVLAGWSDWLTTQQAERRVGLVHATVNAVGIGAYAVSLLRRARGHGRGASILGALTLGVGGWLGGHLAYAQGVGVDTTAFQAGPTGWTDVAASAEVTTALRQVDAGGVALLLIRTGGTVRALADRCTHRGGPLSGGTVADGCVVCPWHASVFALADGTVRRGPATRPQPTYEVRETGGRISVRRVEKRSLRTNPV